MPVSRQDVFDQRRSRVSDLAPQDTGLLELDETLRERAWRDRPERLAELTEARAPVVRGVQDRNRVAPLEEIRRAPNVLGDGSSVFTP